MPEKLYSRIDIANALIPVLEHEYVRDNALAARELDYHTSTCSRPLYYANGERVMGDPEQGREVGSNLHWDKAGFHRDHFAGREYVLHPSDIPSSVVNNERVFGTYSTDKSVGFQHPEGLPDGIRLACRIWGVLGFERGTNNTGALAHFDLQSLFAEGTYIRPTAELAWLPRQFQSEQRIDKLAGFCPKAANYLKKLLLSTKDPFFGQEDLLAKVAQEKGLVKEEFDRFLKAASSSIRKRPWRIPLEDGPNMTHAEWDAAVAELDAAITELTTVARSGSDARGASAAEYAKWTLFNGLRVNHWAFLTGSLDDTLLLNIINGEKVVARAGLIDEHDEFKLNSFLDPITGVEFGGLFQAGIAAPKTFEIFQAPAGRTNYIVEIEGPFVEFIERVLIKENDEWKEMNHSFLPANALQVFKSTMPNTRAAGTWATKWEMRLQDDPKAVFLEAIQRGWMLSAARMLDKRLIVLSLDQVEALRNQYEGTLRSDVGRMLTAHLAHAQSMPMRA